MLVTGAAGLLGTEIVCRAQERGHDVVAADHGRLDVTMPEAVRDAVGSARPDAIVHCAAYTAVDRAESEPELARSVNRDGARHVAEAAADHGIRLAYISTDYVFDGRKRSPYLPDDPTAPLSVYGKTKLEGEVATREMVPRALITRTSWLYGAGAGFVGAILRRAREGEALRVVRDQRGRPTWALNAASAVVELLEHDAEGVFHVADGGECTWLELARAVLSREGVDAPLEGVTTAEFGAEAPRPSYSVLDVSATEETLGREMMNWREALGRCLDEDKRR